MKEKILKEEIIKEVLTAVDKLRVDEGANFDEPFDASFSQIKQLSCACQITISKYIKILTQQGYLFSEEKAHGCRIALTKEGYDFLLDLINKEKMMRDNLQSPKQNAHSEHTVMPRTIKCSSGCVFELPTANLDDKLSIKESARIARRNGYMTVREKMKKR